MYLVTADEMREMDNRTIDELGIPGLLLMENAGRGATDFFLEIFGKMHPMRVAVIAGRGNNGGDGFVMARYLSEKAIPITVFLLARKRDVKGDAATNLAFLDRLSIPVVEMPDAAAFTTQQSRLRHHNVYIDAILGTGLRSDVKGFFRDVISFMNETGTPIFCVDMPSGLNSDTGQPCGICIQGQASATFGYPKIAHVTHPGVNLTGTLKVVDIGIPSMIAKKVAPHQRLLRPAIARRGIVLRNPDAHKGATGHLLVVAGAAGKTGAAVMTTRAALRTGAGLVTLGAPAPLNPILETQLLEAMTLPVPENGQGIMDTLALHTVVDALNGKQCLAVGPGLGTAPGTKNLVCQLVSRTNVPMVIDADGLNCLADDLDRLKERHAPVVLTPHPGEMARLMKISTQEIQQDRIACARHLATTCGIHVVLKGAGTVIAHPDGMAYVNTTGNAGMASGGMGDVLTGMIAALITQGAPADAAARTGVYLHGAAADTVAKISGPFGYLAGDVIDAIPGQINTLVTARGASFPG